MPVDSGGLAPEEVAFARYPKGTYSTIQEGLLKALASKKLGMNAWVVMVALCRTVYADGRLGRASMETIAARTGLNRDQIAHSMAELRRKKVIVPVLRMTPDGRRVFDRSGNGHIAQYCITRDVWSQVELD